MKNVSGCVRVYQGKWYVVVYWYEGNARRSKQFKTGLCEKGNKRIAQRILQEKLAEFAAMLPPTLEYGNTQFCDYCKIWLEAVQFEVVRSTYINYEEVVTRHIIPYFENADLTISDIERDDIQEFYKYLARGSPEKKALSPTMIKRVHSMLKMIFNYAIDGNIIVKNPCLRTKRPKPPRRKANFYSSEECRELFRCLEGTEIYDLVRVTVMFGLRRSEVLGLKWSAVDLEKDVLSICYTITKMKNEVIESDRTKSNSSIRSFVIEPSLHQLFVSLKAKEEENRAFFGNTYYENDFVFKQPNGQPFDPNHVSNKFSYLLKKNNLRHIRFHDLRHSCASILYEMKYGVKEIQEWLGHSDPRITLSTYTHLFKGQVDNVARQLADVFFDDENTDAIIEK